jgi:class III poly(R)-hydroxyalkanoic acid synthase PhaE subunit
MNDPATDFLRDYQHFAQQSWDTWMRQFSPPAGATTAANPFAPAAASNAAQSEPVQRVLEGLKGYTDWLQRVAGGMLGGAGGEPWSQPLQQMFGMFAPPTAAASGGTAHATPDPLGWWREWMAAATKAMPGGASAMPDWFPSFGYGREQQAQQQSMMHAALQYAETFRHYQALLMRAHSQGLALLQHKLGSLDPTRPVESLKALYDLWVDAAEEAYAQIALSQEFRETYAAMVNAQMQLRKQQLSQVEQLCRELGVPTRSEMDSLGERLQQLRREWRASGAATEATESAPASDHSARDEELSALRREIASLRRALHERPASAAAAKPATASRKPAARPSRPGAASKATKAAPSKSSKTVAGGSLAKPAAKSAKSPGTSAPRKRR